MFEHRLLEKIYRTDLRIEGLLEELVCISKQSLKVQIETLYVLKQRPATSLQITQIGDSMQQFDPGATGIVLQAVFTPAGSTALNPGFTVSWTDSNSFCTFSNDASDTTGLTQDVVVSTSATVGTSGVITATATGTFPDGTAGTLTGTFNYTIGAAPSNNATGLGITQIA